MMGVCNMGALVVRMGFWSPSDPENSIGNFSGPYSIMP